MITSDIRSSPTNVFYREVDLVLKNFPDSHTIKTVAGPSLSRELLRKAIHRVELEVKEMLPQRRIVLGDIIEVRRHKVRKRRLTKSK